MVKFEFYNLWSKGWLLKTNDLEHPDLIKTACMRLRRNYMCADIQLLLSLSCCLPAWSRADAGVGLAFS